MKVVSDLVDSIIWDGKLPKDWEGSYLINLHKGKGDALSRENYRGFKLSKHVMKMSELVPEMLLESQKELMICSLSLCQGVVQHMPYLSQDSCRKNFLKRTKINNLHFFFFPIWVFFHEHSQITGLQGKGEGISLTPHYHFHPLHRHLDISRAITAESSPPHIASSRTRTGDLWFPSASR